MDLLISNAEQRAERELAKLDEGMDLIMAKPENRAALVNAPGQVLQPPGGRSSPGSAGASTGMTPSYLAR